MPDAVLIKECADPTLKPAIVEQFVEAAGSDDPLAITVRSGGRLILVPQPKSAVEAVEIIRKNVRGSIVRVGLTQFPAGIGNTDPSELNAELFEPCANLRRGTAIFARILRIVARWYGNPTNDEVFPQLFDDAVYAWQTGEFEGQSIFQAQDPGGAVMQLQSASNEPAGSVEKRPSVPSPAVEQAEEAGIRIDLSKIGGR
ncbi:TraH family protein [Agrobacterium rhizogenes]|uniref:TraH family protein n=1 Tax=Rhizobium rhizogenes TaxID=359 RepID=UPI0022B64009|nr:TraH family protein [Rhizobium rhizogenes]MCZ7450259.1 TraH family protein [Rhizobium rhizogenes]